MQREPASAEKLRRLREAHDHDAQLRRRHGGDEFSPENSDEDADPAPLLSPRTGPTAQRRLRVVKSHESGLDRLDARSEAGSVSILSERTQALVRQTATAAVENLLRPPLHCAAAGAVCMFGPPLIVAVSPLLLVLLPLTLPFGLMLTILGLATTQLSHATAAAGLPQVAAAWAAMYVVMAAMEEVGDNDKSSKKAPTPKPAAKAKAAPKPSPKPKAATPKSSPAPSPKRAAKSPARSKSPASAKKTPARRATRSPSKRLASKKTK